MKLIHLFKPIQKDKDKSFWMENKRRINRPGAAAHPPPPVPSVDVDVEVGGSVDVPGGAEELVVLSRPQKFGPCGLIQAAKAMKCGIQLCSFVPTSK